jgi:hypothetical protein
MRSVLQGWLRTRRAARLAHIAKVALPRTSRLPLGRVEGKHGTAAVCR